MKRTPLRRVSEKKKIADAQLRVVVEKVRRRANGWCEANTPACRSGAHQGAHAHHVLRRSQGGGHDESNLVWTCFDGHTWIHAHPAEAVERGLLGRTFPR